MRYVLKRIKKQFPDLRNIPKTTTDYIRSEPQSVFTVLLRGEQITTRMSLTH